MMSAAAIPLRPFEYVESGIALSDVVWLHPQDAELAACHAQAPDADVAAPAAAEPADVFYDIVYEMDAVPFDWSPANLQVPEVDSAPARFDLWKHPDWSLRWRWWAPPANDVPILDDLLDEERLFLDFLIEQMVTTC